MTLFHFQFLNLFFLGREFSVSVFFFLQVTHCFLAHLAFFFLISQSSFISSSFISFIMFLFFPLIAFKIFFWAWLKRKSACLTSSRLLSLISSTKKKFYFCLQFLLIWQSCAWVCFSLYLSLSGFNKLFESVGWYLSSNLNFLAINSSKELLVLFILLAFWDSEFLCGSFLEFNFSTERALLFN